VERCENSIRRIEDVVSFSGGSVSRGVRGGGKGIWGCKKETEKKSE